MSKILVTGGCGYIGSHTIVDLINNGFEVICVDNNVRSSPRILEGVEKITGKKIKNYKDIFNGPAVSFGPNIRQGANSSFLAEVKGGKWTRVTEPLGF